MPAQKRGSYCVAAWCSNFSGCRIDNPLSFFRFPNEAKRCDQWAKFALREDLLGKTPEELRSMRLCSEHFEVSQFKDGPRRLLYDFAIPTITEAGLECNDHNSTSTSMFPVSDHHQDLSYTDCTILDHDYVGTRFYSNYHIQEENKLASQHILQDMKKEFCRLCGQKGSVLKPIFQTMFPAMEQEQNMPISAKIDLYFPFKVQLDDPLPCNVCEQCFKDLNHWHEFYVNCVAANAVLWKTFGNGCDETSGSVEECSTASRDEEKLGERDEEKFGALETCTEEEIHHEIVTVNALDFLDKEEDDHTVQCSACGMHVKVVSSEKSDPLIAELDSFLKSTRSMFSRCSYCYEFFANFKERKAHVTNCRELPTICDVCGKEFRHRKSLRSHLDTKHKPKILKMTLCASCGKCFDSVSLLQKHTKTVHESQSPKFCCDLCCTAFVDEQSLKIHEKNHEKGLIKSNLQIKELVQYDGTVYTCPVCQEKFNDKLSLVVHLTSKKEMKCPVCHKLLVSEKNFMLHVCDEWLCQFCSKKFKQRVYLRIHERAHTGEKPYKCRMCDKAFLSYHQRYRHENSHQPAHKCPHCCKEFRNKYWFKDHVQHHEGKVFECPICGKRFKSRMNVGKHLNLIHKKSSING